MSIIEKRPVSRRFHHHHGIMTLTRNPCELDTMSLFQEMKLKRRKVDSRCSSDGESVADTSTSSPDLASPVSPCPKPAPSPANRDRASPDSVLSDVIHRRDDVVVQVKKELDDGGHARGVEPQEKDAGDDNSVFDGGGDGDVERQTKRATSPAPAPTPAPNQHQQQHVIQSPVQRQRSYEQCPSPQQRDFVQQQQQQQRAFDNPPVMQTSSILQRTCEGLRDGQQVIQSSHREVIMQGQKTIMACPSPQRMLSYNSNQVREIIHSPVAKSEHNSPPLQREVIQSPIRSLGPCPSPSLRLPINQQRHPQDRVLVTVSSPGSNPGANSFWMTSPGSNPVPCRINGVRPELIGGHVNYPSSPVGHHEMKSPMTPAPRSPSVQQLRPAPTVIMGEAGGVRTMIWSQPQQVMSNSMDGQQQQMMTSGATAASTSTSCWSTSSSSSGNGGVSNEEAAAQLLLNLGQELPHQNNATPSRPVSQFQAPLNMERLWAGDLTQLPASQQIQALNLTSTSQPPTPTLTWAQQQQQHQHQQRIMGEQKSLPPVMTIIGNDHHPEDQDDDDQPMICMICEDKATGLHYGIITCEGCKGFFKRTVQNRRVYTCVADGNCEITKAQRNRCQYCRFKKCIEQGMVLQAVREDRMPGGRNSGAVYNLYKVKYKKHKKAPKNGQVKANAMEKQKGMMQDHGLPPNFVNGTILKTALTNPSEVVHLRQRLDNAVSSSRDRAFTIEATLSMIQTLIDCDEFQDIATLRNLDELLDHKSDLSEKLCQIGDSIVYKLVQWTKRLPFYLELPVEVHTRLLTHKWHELLVLTTSAYQAIHGAHKMGSTGSDGTEADFTQEVSNNLCTLQTCLTSMMGRPITMDQLRQDVGLMVEKITHVTLMFRRVKIRMEEYVCLKVITMLNQGRGGSNELEAIQDRYMTCLRSFVDHNFPQQPTRFHELLVRLPEVQSAAALLLESKMFYVPFLLNSAIQR